MRRESRQICFALLMFPDLPFQPRPILPVPLYTQC